MAAAERPEPLTALRRELLENVARGEVTYQKSTAEWFERGSAATGWRARSLSSLRHRDQYIEVPEPNAPASKMTVRLTDAGRKALGQTDDTPPAD